MSVVLLANFAVFSSVITAILFLSSLKYFRSYPFSILLLYITISGVVDLATYITSRYGINNLSLINCYYLAQFVMSFAFLQFFFKNKLLSMIGILCAVSLIAFSVFDIYLNSKLFKIATQSMSLQTIALSAFAILALLSRTFKTSILLTQDPVFWFISAILFYGIMTALIFVTSEIHDKELNYIRNNTWVINSFATIFSNILYLIGLRCLKTQMKSSMGSL